MEVDSEGPVQVDDYLKYKKLEKQLEHLDVMEEYIKLETRNLEKELLHAQEEVFLLELTEDFLRFYLIHYGLSKLYA